MPDVWWTAKPAANVADWTRAQADEVAGECGSCDRVTTLRADPMVGQEVCRPCWESMMFGDDDHSG